MDKPWLPTSGSCFDHFEADQCAGCYYSSNACPFPDMGRLHDAAPKEFPAPPWRRTEEGHPYCAMRCNEWTGDLQLRKSVDK
jgi:Fe-S-cluster-containing dehydrogenase component